MRHFISTDNISFKWRIEFDDASKHYVVIYDETYKDKDWSYAEQRLDAHWDMYRAHIANMPGWGTCVEVKRKCEAVRHTGR